MREVCRTGGASQVGAKEIQYKEVTYYRSCFLPVQVLPFNLSPYSPFKIKTLPAHDASKVRASGPGLNASGVPASLPVEFTIDARDAGEGLLTVQILVSG